MARNKAVIFDMDDTLFLESSYVLSGFQAVAEWAESELQLSAIDSLKSLINIFENGARGNIFNLWLEHFNKRSSIELIQTIVKIYREHEPTISPFNEIPSLLNDLSRCFKIGLVSDGFLVVQKKKFAALQLRHFFDAVCFSDQLGREHWKPSAKPFELVSDKLQTPPENCIYVGDNPKKDFLGARNAGMQSIRIRIPGGQYEALEPEAKTFSPDEEIRSFVDLHLSITRLFDQLT
ncbi:HAD family hydrolase [Mariniblastus sp.]|nr:HAD family hydrolase [Mariniblastus sp.]